MKKVISILMTLAFMFAFITGCTAAESDKQALDNEFLLTMQIANPVMTVNGQEKNIDDDGTAPTIVSDRTLVPVRAIIEWAEVVIGTVIQAQQCLNTTTT